MVNRVVNDTVNEVVKDAKRQGAEEKPSRAKYEQSHPVFSARVDKETYDDLKQHLEGTGCSFSDCLKDALGREDSMIEKRVETLARRKGHSGVGEMLRCLEDLMSQVMIAAYDRQTPWACPRCHPYQPLLEGMIAKKGSKCPDVFVFACPKCRFLLTPWSDAPNGVD